MLELGVSAQVLTHSYSDDNTDTPSGSPSS